MEAGLETPPPERCLGAGNPAYKVGGGSLCLHDATGKTKLYGHREVLCDILFLLCQLILNRYGTSVF